MSANGERPTLSRNPLNRPVRVESELLAIAQAQSDIVKVLNEQAKALGHFHNKLHELDLRLQRLEGDGK